MRRRLAPSLTTLSAAITLGLLSSLCSSATAQEWAAKMVDKLDHDFGAVARGSDTVYKFKFKNIYKEDVHLASVRSSCGCTSPSIENNLIKTYGEGYIVAKFNTRTFTGLHSATLTVTIDKPYPAQVQLRVHGDIRGDVVFQPGSVNFGKVDQGTTPEKRVDITYAGRQGWKIEDVRSANGGFEVELAEKPRYGGKASYELLVRLKEDADPGYLGEQLVIVTNDPRTPRIPLDVQGQVIPEISVSPPILTLGDVAAGQSVKKRVIVKGKKPFRILSMGCGDDCFQFKTDEQSRERHIVEVLFNASDKPGPLKKAITVTTDRGKSFSATCTAYATVKPAPKSSGLGSPDTEAAPATATSDAEVEADSTASKDNVATKQLASDQ